MPHVRSILLLICNLVLVSLFVFGQSSLGLYCRPIALRTRIKLTHYRGSCSWFVRSLYGLVVQKSDQDMADDMHPWWSLQILFLCFYFNSPYLSLCVELCGSWTLLRLLLCLLAGYATNSVRLLIIEIITSVEFRVLATLYIYIYINNCIGIRH